MLKMIDAHQHYWQLDRGDYGWLSPEQSLLYQDYTPEHLRPQLNKNGIAGTIVVQAAQTIAETEYLLALSEFDHSILGVVGWIDLQSPDFKLHFERLRKHPKFVGIRLMIQEMEDAERVLEDDYVEALTYFAELQFPVDLLLYHHQLPVLTRLIERIPHLRGVINHIGKPSIADGMSQEWMEHMIALSQFSNISCKLSGMVTEAHHQRWRQEQFVPFVLHVLNHFGMDRVMFGSDWPVCLLAAQYDEVIEVLENCLPKQMSSENREKIFGINAINFYRLAQ